MDLNAIMEFDHVVRVHDDGTVTAEDGIYGPNLLDDDLDGPGWTLLDGYSGQDRYSGPIMHDSEFIGGQMAEDILSEPGVYVVIATYYSPETDDDDLVCEGWAVARKNA